MKVAVITRYFPTSHSPWAGHSAYQTLRQLAKLAEVHVFCPETTYPSFLTPKTGRRGALDRTWRPGEVDVTYIPYLTVPVVSRPVNGYVMGRTLLEPVRAFQPDVILNYVIYPDGYAAVRIGQTLGIPVVLKAIGSDLNRISDPVCAALTRTALREADAVTTVSYALGEVAKSMGASPGHTIAILNGCDTNVFYPRDRAAARETLQLPPDVEAVVFVGRFDVRKGLCELIEAMAKLHAKRPAAHCYIVGDGPDKPKLVEAIAKHHAEEWISLVPSCPTKQVALWMAAADVVTLPSYMEGCPNVVIEALATGRPVVATRVGGIPELMDETAGRMIAPMNAGALAEALDDVLGRGWDPQTISSRHGRGWEEAAAEVLSVLKDAVIRRAANKTD